MSGQVAFIVFHYYVQVKGLGPNFIRDTPSSPWGVSSAAESTCMEKLANR